MVMLSLILSVFILIFQSENVLTTEIQIDRIEFVNTTFMEGIYNVSELRISRINRTTYALSAELTFYVDFDKNWVYEISFFRNRFNNNQYYKMPFGLSKRTVCETFEPIYQKHVQAVIKDISNLPQLKEGEHICPLKRYAFHSFSSRLLFIGCAE